METKELFEQTSIAMANLIACVAEQIDAAEVFRNIDLIKEFYADNADMAYHNALLENAQKSVAGQVAYLRLKKEQES